MKWPGRGRSRRRSEWHGLQDDDKIYAMSAPLIGWIYMHAAGGKRKSKAHGHETGKMYGVEKDRSEKEGWKRMEQSKNKSGQDAKRARVRE